MLKFVTTAAVMAALSTAAAAQGVDTAQKNCSIPNSIVNQIQSQLKPVSHLNNGGLFSPSLMWSAVVDRQGYLCSVIKTGDAWPGSRAIAIAKASAANDFSNVKLALSTAMLYGPTQPGGSLYGLNNSNPFNPDFNQQGTGLGFVPGGIITFGGGVALYSDGQVIGGLGVSGDTSCADHVIAYRMRRAAGFDGVPGGVGADNIQYPATPGEPVSGFEQPHCLATDIPPGSI